MRDAVLQNLRRARRVRGGPARNSYYLATLHRQENVDDPARLGRLLDALQSLGRPVLLPLHPRTAARLQGLGRQPGGDLRVLPPQPYLQMLRLLSGARIVLTDSGGVQKEAHMLGTPCITLRDTTEWVETLARGANRLVGSEPARIRAAVADVERRAPRWDGSRMYGDGRASERIADVIVRHLAR
jgi:UDP-N-acetylglucosamine 2-epimerase